MINNYIFDFGNVLAEFYPEKLTAPFVSDKERIKRISDVVFDRLYWDKLDEGTISDDKIRAEICSRLSGDDSAVACKVYDNWVNSLTPVENMEKLVCDIKEQGKKLYLLSNISKGFAEQYGGVQWIKELLDKFDGIVLSGPIGKIKPNRNIFEHLIETYGLKADESLFIDDNKANIEGAESAGIKGYLFDGDANKLREYIRGL